MFRIFKAYWKLHGVTERNIARWICQDGMEEWTGVGVQGQRNKLLNPLMQRHHLGVTLTHAVRHTQ